MTADYGEDPQLKLLLLSQRLTSLKRQRAYNLTDIVGETESPNNMDVDLGNEFGEEEEKEGDDDDDVMWKPFRSNDKEDNVNFTNNTEERFEGERDGEHFDMNSLQRQSGGDVFNGEYVDIDEDFVAGRSINCDLHFHKIEGEEDDDEDVIDFKALAISKHSRIDKPEAECSKTGVGFSRIADYYRYPEFLHDVTIRKVKDFDVDNDNDNDCPTGIVGESGEEEAVTIKRDASSDERKPLPTKKSASNMKSASKLKSGLKQKLKQTLSGRLLEISDDVTPSSDTAMARMDTLFHQCVCTFPWKCKYSTLAPQNSPANVYHNEEVKKVSHAGSGTGNQLHGRDDLTGWSLPRSERGAQYGYGGGGRKVSSARDSNRRRKYDPFIHRNISDSSKYTFKHYQDWQAYVDEYRRYYTVGQTGMAMKSHPIPEGGGRREAVVIVRTLSESLVRPRLQECNIPDWDDFTDLSATPMRPLHLGPSYRSGKVPDLGVTWLAAATAHHHEVPAGYRHPASRHIKLTNIRHAESTGTQLKKRHQQALLESSSSTTPRVGTILPHDAGVKIPMEPMHIVEDFRTGPRKEKVGADMQPIGCRFLTSWRPNESTRVKSAKGRSRKSRMDGKTSEVILAEDSSSPRGQIFSKQGSLQPLMNGQGQTRAGLLKLFTSQKVLDVLHVPSGADVTGQVTDTNGMKFKSKASVAARSVDASKWTNLPTSADKSSSKSRADLLDKTASEKGSATRSGTLARRPTARLHNETQAPQKELLQVRGESKKNKPMEVESGDGEMPPSSSSPKEKDGGLFGKTRIKLVAPYAQPLAQDNVLIGSPYGTSPLFANEELSTTV